MLHRLLDSRAFDILMDMCGWFGLLVYICGLALFGLATFLVVLEGVRYLLSGLL